MVAMRGEGYYINLVSNGGRKALQDGVVPRRLHYHRMMTQYPDWSE